VCHSPTSFALRKSFGLSGATGSFIDIEDADVCLLLGVNPTQGHRVVGARIKQAALRGCQLITIDPRRIELADYGVIHLSPRPGTNAAVVLGLCHVVRRDGLSDEAFIGERTEGYEAVEELLEAYTPEAVEEITGIPAGHLERAAHIYGEADSGSLLWGLGVTEHTYGSEVVQLLCNLAMITGKVGKPGSALLPLRGQNNVQGSSDMGALPDTYTAYRRVDDEETARQFEEAWGVSLSRNVGYKIPEMFDAAIAGELKAMYIFGEDIAQTDPDTAHVVKAMESLEFVVCQEIFEDETTTHADVILPASAFLEKAGTFTNAERRFQAVEPAIDPPGGARTTSTSSPPSAACSATRWAGKRRGTQPTRSHDSPPSTQVSAARASAARASSGQSVPTAPARRPSTTGTSTTRRGRVSSPRCPTRRRATRPTMSSRSCSSPAACCSTTTPAR
jgi:predicted molibdopterin-dependent oxidoreductase YjgC